MKNIQQQINRFLIFINSKITKNMIAQYLLWKQNAKFAFEENTNRTSY